uniref:Uncharacterized protein n=1 Tax=Oryza sativa subsp. japonica TaxID=39947 RepID=Q6K4V1_ORYSJ|nr:hypothetical protein [Oryza sativa Japonica Group]
MEEQAERVADGGRLRRSSPGDWQWRQSSSRRSDGSGGDRSRGGGGGSGGWQRRRRTPRRPAAEVEFTREDGQLATDAELAREVAGGEEIAWVAGGCHALKFPPSSFFKIC